MTFERSDLKRMVLAGALVGAITSLHYATNPHELPLHVAYRDMYFIPILLMAVRFGKWGGIITASVITAFYGPHVAMSMHTPESTVGNVLGIGLFYLMGTAVGTYADVRRDYERKVRSSGEAQVSRSGHKILLCVDQTSAGQNAVMCTAGLFGKDPEVSITLLCSAAEPNPDLLANAEEAAKEASSAIAGAQNAIRRATDQLAECGVPAASLSQRIVGGEMGRLSDAILREQREGHYDTIVIGKQHLTRAQEFLFGDVAVRLARQAPCPVLVVGEQDRRRPAHDSPSASTAIDHHRNFMTCTARNQSAGA